MAVPSILKDTYVNVLYGDGATPEVFTVLCFGQPTKDLTITYAAQYETTLKDCANPEDVGYIARDVGPQDWSISINGQMNRANMDAIRGLMGAKKNFRFELDEPPAPATAVDAGYWQGVGMISELSFGTTDGEFVSLSISITGAGLMTWTDA